MTIYLYFPFSFSLFHLFLISLPSSLTVYSAHSTPYIPSLVTFTEATLLIAQHAACSEICKS